MNVEERVPEAAGAGDRRRLIERQCRQAMTPDGTIDLAKLKTLVADAYDGFERDRRRTDRSITLMAEENEQLTQELQRSLEAMAESNARFEAAQENMVHGLAMFGREEPASSSPTRRFREIYGFDASSLHRRATLDDLLACVARDSSPEAAREAEWMRRIAAMAARGRVLTREIRLDGRQVIELTVSGVKGGGWLSVHRDVTEQRAALARIAHMATHDALTDIGNRTLFSERLPQAMVRLNRNGKLAVLCLDLDGFKAINDTLGHPAGDELLKGVTQRLKECVGDGDLLARLGGDEFAIIQDNADQPRSAMQLASKIIDAISQAFRIDGQDVNVGVSIGVAIAPDHSADRDDLLRNADIALYRAKAEGRGVARAFELGMDARLRERRLLEIELREAIEQAQFEMHYQPLVNLEAGRITSFEALIRWRHPDRGLVAPAEFLPLAEETGLIVPIGDLALQLACREAVQWPKDVGVSVNVSPMQFRSGAIGLNVVDALAKSGLSPNRLDLEITETALLKDTEVVLQTLSRLRAIGVRISMDDFGTGYSSLSYLHCFPFDRIKIDRSFLEDFGRRKDRSAIVKAVASLGAALGMATTAEGIETAEQLAQARAHGCTEAQGNYCGRPLAYAELPALFRRHAAVA